MDHVMLILFECQCFSMQQQVDEQKYYLLLIHSTIELGIRADAFKYPEILAGCGQKMFPTRFLSYISCNMSLIRKKRFLLYEITLSKCFKICQLFGNTHGVFVFFFILLYFKIFPNKPWRVNTWGQKSNKKCSIKLLTQLALKYDPPSFIWCNTKSVCYKIALD